MTVTRMCGRLTRGVLSVVLCASISVVGSICLTARVSAAEQPVNASGTNTAPVTSTTTSPASQPDPYTWWSHGRPGDAIPALYQQAEQTQRWDAWCDVGLAALAAERRGEAAVWLVRAHQLAPDEMAPRQALQTANITLPPGWLDWVGPLAWPGRGWWGLLSLSVAGLVIGYAINQRRWWWLTAGVAVVVSVAPGRLAYEWDRQRLLLATVRDSQLYDSAGRPLASVAQGSVVVQESTVLWGQRVLVRDVRGQRGYLPLVDTQVSLLRADTTPVSAP